MDLLSCLPEQFKLDFLARRRGDVATLMEISLKYGCNPNQEVARVLGDGDPGPLEIINGAPSYINILDALRGWQLVRELKGAIDVPAAASFKHVSPAGAAVAAPLSEAFCAAHFIQEASGLSPVATAYARARSSDRVASFGDFIAVSESVDRSLADLIKPEVSDGIIAPDYDEGVVETLRTKKKGSYVILRMAADFEPPATEYRLEFGLRLEQIHNRARIDKRLFRQVATKSRSIPSGPMQSLIVATITLKHTQSNSIVVGWEGQAVGIGAGQQSRIACTRLACDKADRWMLKMHPKARSLQFRSGLPRAEKVNVLEQFVRYHELDERERGLLEAAVDVPIDPITPSQRHQWIKSFKGSVLSSDAFIPFRDNLDRAASSGIGFIAQSGGSARDQDVVAAADEYGMVMAFTGLRLFLH